MQQYKIGDRVFVANPQWGSVIGTITRLLYAEQLYLIIQSDETGKLFGVPATACLHVPEDGSAPDISEMDGNKPETLGR